MTCLRSGHPVSAAPIDLFSDGSELYRWCNTAHLSLTISQIINIIMSTRKQTQNVIVITTRTFKTFAGRNARSVVFTEFMMSRATHPLVPGGN